MNVATAFAGVTSSLRQLMLCSLFVLATVSASAQLVSDPKASLDGIDAEVKRLMDTLHVPGVAAGVVVDGKVIFAKGYGVRDINKPDLVDADTIFDIGSMSKSFTATAVAAMVDDGKLAWDKPVIETIPWFQLPDPVATQLATPRDMLSHRTGLAGNDFLRYDIYQTREQLVRRLRYLNGGVGFRQAFLYNNLIYTTAGYLAGVAAGSSWEDLVKQRIFIPLGMTHSNTSATELQQSSDFAHPNSFRKGKIVPTEIYEYQKYGAGPNGAVNSCINDMLKYLAFHLADGKVGDKQVISVAQMKELHTPVTVLPQREANYYGPWLGAYALGWFVDEHRHHPILEHAGGITGFGTDMAILPNEKTGVVVLHNQETELPEILVKEILDRLLGLPPEDYLAESQARRSTYEADNAAEQAKFDAGRIPNAKPTLDLSAYTGAYFNPAMGIVHIEREGDKDLAVRFDAATLSLKHYNYDTFAVWGDEIAQFQLSPSGKVADLLLPLEDDKEGDNEKPFVLVKQDQ